MIDAQSFVLVVYGKIARMGQSFGQQKKNFKPYMATRN